MIDGFVLISMLWTLLASLASIGSLQKTAHVELCKLFLFLSQQNATELVVVIEFHYI